jgi:hypothetical protein
MLSAGEATQQANVTPTPAEGMASIAAWNDRVARAVAVASLLGVAFLCGLVLSKRFFLGSDSAHHYAHVWYIADQLFHHGRLPLRIDGLESGHTLTFPYGVVPWLLAAPFDALVGDWAVTGTMVAGFVLYGYAATRARPALRDVRLLSLLYANTFLIESLVSFQMAFLWSVVLFLFYVEQVDRQRWAPATLLAIATLVTHPFFGAISVSLYVAYALARRPRTFVPMLAMGAVTTIVVLPYALYLESTPVVHETRHAYMVGTLEWMLRFRSPVLIMPFLLSAIAPLAKHAYLVMFVLLAAVFTDRIMHEEVNTFGFDRYSRPFYGEFMRSPAYDPSLNYRVLEPNDREDGAYQLFRHGAHLSQDFFDQTQVRRWWNSEEQYTCFLGARDVDVVLLEKDYTLKFDQNEDARLRDLENEGRAKVLYSDPRGRFVAVDVRGARRDGAAISDCGL